MITADEWKAYNDAVSKISDGAAASVENAVLGWCRSNPNATVAESRETAKLIMEGYMQSYDGLASAFAARWYDHQAESNGINLQNAVTTSVYTPKKTDSVARYQVRKLTREGPSAFAKACGDYARNDALRALNETIIANVGRDKKKGVRFARVPTGRETCTFCIMLASRGAVYHTRKSAGEFKHFHRHCDCKVVPGFEDDPDAELVEGYKPKELYKLWKRFKEIEAYGLPKVQENALKIAAANATGNEIFLRATSNEHLVNALDAGINDALKRSRKNKTIASYDTNVGTFLELLGNVYNIELTGERFNNKKGKCVGAAPNGEELWIAVKAGISGQFLYAITEGHRPDMETKQGDLIEFKTPRSKGKLNKLLLESSCKFDDYPAASRNTIVSLLMLPDAIKEARDAAVRFVQDGTLDAVWVLDNEGNWANK